MRSSTGVSNSTKIIIGIAVALIAGWCIFWVPYFGLSPKYITDRYPEIVAVENGGTRAIADVVLRFSGGEIRLTEIPGRTGRTVLVNVLGESGLDLQFTDSAGKEHRKAIDVYLEGNSTGEIILEIDPTGNVVCKDRRTH